MVWTFLKNMLSRLFRLLLPTHLLLNPFAPPAFTVHDRARLVLRAERDAVPPWRGVRRQAGEVPARRAVVPGAIRAALDQGRPAPGRVHGR